MIARHILEDLEQVGAADLEAPLEVRSLRFSSPVEPQRARTAAQCARRSRLPASNRSAVLSSWSCSALVLVLVLSQVCYDHLGLAAAQRARLELPWRSAWPQAPLEVLGLPFFFTNLSFPAQSCTSLSVDHLDIGLLHPTAQPLCSFVALACGGSPIVCGSSSLGLPASSIAVSSNFFHRWVCQRLSRGNSATASAVAAVAGIYREHHSTAPAAQGNARTS